MRPLLLPPLLALAACATPPQPEPQQTGDACAVVAAVAKEHYRFGPDNVPPPLKLEGWSPNCDWSRHGVSFPQTYASGPRWVEFKRPSFDGSGAEMETSIMHGPLAGMGYRCRVRSGFAGWTVERCEAAWVS